jgi:ubiquinone/menaquinone biosynthesis C-methylase UbiE
VAGLMHSHEGGHRKFDPARLHVLNDPDRVSMLDPDLLWRSFGVEQPRVAIDLGAGTGFFAVRFAHRMAESGTVYACDVSEQMVRWMEDHLSAEQRRRIVPLHVRESAVDLPDGIAQLVYMINVYHELDDPQEVLREARRLLCDGGVVAVVDWRKDRASTVHGPPLSIRLASRLVRRDMRAAGLREIREVTGLPFHHFLVCRK